MFDNCNTWSSVDPALTETIITASLQTYSWTLPTVASVECKVKITDAINNTILDESDSNFRIVGTPYNVPISWKF